MIESSVAAVADSFGEVLVPTEEVVEIKDGKKRKI
jgi:transcriptional antiterminator NusG